MGGVYKRTEGACGVVLCAPWPREINHHSDGKREQCWVLAINQYPGGGSGEELVDMSWEMNSNDKSSVQNLGREVSEDENRV